MKKKWQIITLPYKSVNINLPCIQIQSIKIRGKSKDSSGVKETFFFFFCFEVPNPFQKDNNQGINDQTFPKFYSFGGPCHFHVIIHSESRCSCWHTRSCLISLDVSLFLLNKKLLSGLAPPPVSFSFLIKNCRMPKRTKRHPLGYFRQLGSCGCSSSQP